MLTSHTEVESHCAVGLYVSKVMILSSGSFFWVVLPWASLQFCVHFFGNDQRCQALFSVPLCDLRGLTGILSFSCALCSAFLVLKLWCFSRSSSGLAGQPEGGFLFLSLYFLFYGLHEASCLFYFFFLCSLRITNSSCALWYSDNDECFKNFNFSRYTC